MVAERGLRRALDTLSADVRHTLGTKAMAAAATPQGQTLAKRATALAAASFGARYGCSREGASGSVWKSPKRFPSVSSQRAYQPTPSTGP